MSTQQYPTRANGKICYLEIPSSDSKQSASFYKHVFNWTIREDNGNYSFDDTVGEVSGMWVEGRKPDADPGILISIMVESIETTAKAIIANGGKMAATSDINTSERTALFSDPTGNVFCLYQSGKKKNE